MELRIPKLRKGSFFPVDPGAAAADRPGAVCGGDGGLRERRLHPRGRRPGRRARRRLGHLQVGGVADLRRPGRAGRTRSGPDRCTTPTFPYVFLDATYLHVRRTGQVTSHGRRRRDRGHRRRRSGDPRRRRRRLRGRGVLARRSCAPSRNAAWPGCSWSSPTSTPAWWPRCSRVFQGVGHQRCRVHFARNLLALVPKAHKDMVAAVFRTDLRPAQPRRQSRLPGTPSATSSPPGSPRSGR